MSRLLRTNLAMNPRMTTPSGTETRPSDGVVMPGVLRADAAGKCGAGGGARNYVEGGYAVTDGLLASSTVPALYTLSRTPLSELGLSPGDAVGIAVRYSQDAPHVGSFGARARSLVVGLEDADGTNNLNHTWSSNAPNLAQEDTLLACALTLPTDTRFITLRLVLGVNGPGNPVNTCRWRRLIICEGDTEEQALAAVTGHKALP